ncbi:MAG: DinB family protein [Gemmataceae bacterium]|nr:DinB family protein [Gemmataceae bacterium]
MTFAELIDAYRAGPQTLRQAVAGMNREQLLARPVPGKWSTLEVVCHLADFEPVHADRMKRVLTEDRPLFFSADEQRYAAALAYHERDLEEELSLIERTRQQMVRILRTLPPEAWSRTGVYRHDNQDEPRTLERLVAISAGHIPHHVRFVLEKRRALGTAT